MEWFLLFLKIMMINIVLSGDNAVVIALVSKNLPYHQRKLAVWWGAFAAVGLRVLLTIGAVYVLQVPFIQSAGSLLLLWIAIKLLGDEEDHTNIKQASTLASAVWTIMVADFVMSLDNVLAIAAAAEGDIAVIILGIALSIPIIVWGSALVMRLLTQYPVLVYLGAGILGYTAGEMFVSDKAVYGFIFGSTPTWIIPAVTTALVIAAGQWKKLMNTPKSA